MILPAFTSPPRTESRRGLAGFRFFRDVPNYGFPELTWRLVVTALFGGSNSDFAEQSTGGAFGWSL